MKKITQHIKMSIIKRKLAGVFFEYKEIKSQRNIKKNMIIDLRAKIDNIRNLKKNESINNSSKNHILNANRIFTKEHITNKNLNKDYYNEYHDEKNENLFSKEENIKTILNRKDLLSSSIKHNESLSFYENFQYNNPHNKYNKHKMKYIFPYYYFFMDCIFDKILYPEKFFCIPKTYFIVYNYMCQIYDISSHIILFKQFNAIKKLLEDKKCETGSDANSKRKIEKININHTKSIEKLSLDLKKKKSIIFANDLL
jgi:hypothetical protein